MIGNVKIDSCYLDRLAKDRLPLIKDMAKVSQVAQKANTNKVRHYKLQKQAQPDAKHKVNSEGQKMMQWLQACRFQSNQSIKTQINKSILAMKYFTENITQH